MAYNPQRTSLALQSLYSELLSALMNADSHLAGVRPPGTLTSKVIGDRSYWYSQRVEAGRKRQDYLGPETPELLEELDVLRASWAAAADLKRETARLVSMLHAGATRRPDATAARVLEILSERGLFRAGGVLVGSHAFASYGPMLGVRWSDAWQTEDVDLARALRPSLVVAARVDIPEALADSGLSFRPVPGLDPREPATSFTLRGRTLHVELLTPEIGRPSEGPIWIPALNMAAHPLRFLDYLMEAAVPAAIVARRGILVHVPEPARYAVHKLLVAQRRPSFQAVKARKDLVQAGQLLEVLVEDRPGDLVAAWAALTQRADEGAELARRSLARLNADLREAWTALIDS